VTPSPRLGRLAVAVVLAWGLPLAACAPPPVETPAPLRLLAYAPAAEPHLYEVADTVRITTGGTLGNAVIDIVYEAVVELALRLAAGDSLVATLRVDSFAGSLRNAAVGEVLATAADVDGPFTIVLDSRGRGDLRVVPPVTEAFRQVAGVEGFVRPFFITLPPEAVAGGASWTDTLRVVEAADGVRTESETVILSEVAGDTVIGGRTFAVLSSRTTTVTMITGQSEGVPFVQQLTGSGRSRAIWDPERGVLVDRTAEESLSGTMDVPDLDVTGLPLTVTVRRRLLLR
jgi:hypothetical protein